MLGVKAIFLGCLFCALSAERLPKDWASRIDPATLKKSIKIAVSEKSDTDSNQKHLFQGDIRVAEVPKGEYGEDSGIAASEFSGRLDSEKLWPKHGSKLHIAYEISTSFTEDETQMITLALNDITTRTTGCISFRHRSKEPDYLYFSRTTTKRCSSQVGMQGSKQLIILTSNCANSRGRIQHEVLHTLGIYHEQSRPDRDKYVSILEEHITAKMQTSFQKLPEMDTYNTGYDISSVMHFAFNEFSIDPEKPTIIPKPGFSGSRMGQRDGISPLDVAKLKTLYSCPGDIDTDDTSDDETTPRPLHPSATKGHGHKNRQPTMLPARLVDEPQPDEGGQSVDVRNVIISNNLWPNGGKDIPYRLSRRFQWGDANDIMKTLAAITQQTSGCITFKLLERRGRDHIRFSRRDLCDFERRPRRRCRGSGYNGERSFDQDEFRRYERDFEPRQNRRNDGSWQEEGWNTKRKETRLSGWVSEDEGAGWGGRPGAESEGGNWRHERGGGWDECEDRGSYDGPGEGSGRGRNEERAGSEGRRRRGPGRGSVGEEDGEGRNGGRRERSRGQGGAEDGREDAQAGPVEFKTRTGSGRSDGRGAKKHERFRRYSRSSCFHTMEPVLRFIMKEIGVPLAQSRTGQNGQRAGFRFGQSDGFSQYGSFSGRDWRDLFQETESGVELSKVDVERIRSAYGCKSGRAAN